jgi:WD40 repeat protein
MATSQMSEVIQRLRKAVLLRDGAGLTDGQLLEDYICRGEEAALVALLRRHGPMVWGVCRRVLRNYHDAEDAFQATFLVLVRKAASVVPRELVAKGRPITGITYAADDSWVSFREKEAAHLAFAKYMKDGKPLTFGKGTGNANWSLLAMTSDAKTYALRFNDSPDIMIEEKDIKDLKAKIVNPNDLIWCKGHEKVPTCAAFAPDDTLLVTGSADKSARLWDAASGAAKHTLSGHTDAVAAVAFSPDGKLVATGGRDGLVKLWNVKTGKETASLKGHTVVRALAFAPDGKSLASRGEDQTVRIWDAKTGAEQAVLSEHKGTVLTVAFSRDGALLASGAEDKTVRLWKNK